MMLRFFQLLAVSFLLTRPFFAASENPVLTQTQLLSGTDKDHTVDWEFQCTAGRQSGVWTKIPVPSNWEMQGFGTYTYGWNLAPEEMGLYKHTFTPPVEWKGRVVEIVFDGVMTDVEVKINGQSAGPIHQGSFYSFRYDISALLKYGSPNLLEATVKKDSANLSINKAERLSDYWIFGGIYRPVYLEARPVEHITRVALDAQADGSFLAEVHLKNIAKADTLVAQISQLDGTPVGQPISQSIQAGTSLQILKTSISQPKLWTAETPQLYRVEFSLRRGKEEIHRTKERFGFRTIEVRPRDGVYLNGKKIILKGTQRHCFWPDSGRTTSAEISKNDILLMKAMNMNAVLMAHYPPDRHFLELADELGIYVFDELAGWQKAYDTEAGGKLLEEMVIHDVNHPSILFWCNGNEGGWNTELDSHYAMLDPQKRKVLHPWATFSDINTAHYRIYEDTKKILESGELFLPTEFLHGLYDGGAGAGLNDYWKITMSHPNGVGGLIWTLIDEGLLKADENNRIDTSGNTAPDGILGPFRQKEASFYTVRDIWSPLEITAPDPQAATLSEAFDGTLAVENHYDFTDADQVSFQWELVNFPAPDAGETGHRVQASGTAQTVKIAPAASGKIALGLPANWRSYDALLVTAKDAAGVVIDQWSWRIADTAKLAKRLLPTNGETVSATETADAIVLKTGATEISIAKSTGRLAKATQSGTAFSLSDGPILAVGEATLAGIAHRAEGTSQVVEATYTGDLSSVVWRLHGSGWLQLDYRYRLSNPAPFLGVNFSYPENLATGVKWLGQGPYRVWKNRLRGMTTDVWTKPYNDTATGSSVWQYPEFKGYHASTVWAVLETQEGDITVLTPGEGLYLRLFTPNFGVEPKSAIAAMPSGDLSFLDGISAIGNKFNPPAELGPESQLHSPRTEILRTIYFRFTPNSATGKSH